MSLSDTQPLAPAWDARLLDEGRALLRLAAPIMLIALVNMGMSITDTAMVAALFGAEALAAVAVGSDLYSILFYLGAGVLGGLAPFYTAAAVRADPAERARLERIGLILVALLATLLVPVVWLAPDWLAGLGLDPALLDQGRGYTRAIALTLAPMLGVALYRTVLTAAERPRVFLKVTLAMLPLNAAANWLLMTGPGPLPAFGPAGAGIASLLVATASLAILAAIARRGRPRVPAPAADRLARDRGGAARRPADRHRHRRRGRRLPRRDHLRRHPRRRRRRRAHLGAPDRRPRLRRADRPPAGRDGPHRPRPDPRRPGARSRRRHRQPRPRPRLGRAAPRRARRRRAAARPRLLRRQPRRPRRRRPRRRAPRCSSA